MRVTSLLLGSLTVFTLVTIAMSEQMMGMKLANESHAIDENKSIKTSDSKNTSGKLSPFSWCSLFQD